MTAYCRLHDRETEAFNYAYSDTYCVNNMLSKLYEYLVKLGYEISEEEQAWVDGTHEAYMKK